jgi:predicted enzyme related to lactoylglutathione lyase
VDFVAVLDQVIALLRQRGRVAYRTLKVQFHLDDEALAALKDELLYAHQLARDEDNRILVWTGDAAATPIAEPPPQAPLTYTPSYLAEKILTSHSALEGERKQVTVLLADLKGSMELLADRDPEEARQLLDPVLERMMAAVHQYEGTVNQVMGDGITALFGAPLAHEDHAVWACSAALAMQEALRHSSDEGRRTHGLTVYCRIGLNAGEVVVRAIRNCRWAASSGHRSVCPRRNMMKVSGIEVVVQFCVDPEKSQAWYADFLGVETTPYPSPLFVLEGATLLLAPGVLGTGRGGTGVYFHVASVDEAYQELTARGYRFNEEPYDVPVGRLVTLNDPDGNIVGLEDRSKGGLAGVGV